MYMAPLLACCLISDTTVAARVIHWPRHCTGKVKLNTSDVMKKDYYSVLEYEGGEGGGDI